MKGYYIFLSNTPVASFSSGVGDKILTQIKCLNDNGVITNKLSLYNKPGIINKLKIKFTSNYYNSFLPSDFIDCNFFYFRRFMASCSLLGLLKYIKKNTNAKILIEFPTYPYDKEVGKGLNNRITLFIDKIFRKKLNKYVDRIVTFNNDNIIYKIKTIQIANGIDCAKIPVRTRIIDNNSINITAIAQFSNWHGYERLIKGLHLYYQNNPAKKIYLHMAGNGDYLSLYKQLAEILNLKKFVHFYGFLTGSELDDLFNKSNIAACSLGCHRINVFKGSFLKSREYLARGMPMISSTKIDVLPDNYPYCFYVPENETPINIQSVLDFYNQITDNNNIKDIAKEIRQFAETHCDISITMKPVITYLLTSGNNL
ncbi:MAG: glycosyltransferase [Treponema sp.]|jgi:hypothetical protein|nr:glycosyltransferase [Treponema sp.]